MPSPPQATHRIGRVRRRGGRRSGWAIREVAIVGLVLGAFAMLLAPWLLQQRENARRNQCERRIRITGEAILLFEAEVGALPGYANPQTPGDPRGIPTGWLFPCLPFLDAIGADGRLQASSPYSWIVQEYGPLGSEDLKYSPPRERIPAVICPSDPHVDEGPVNLLSWAVNCGLPDDAEQDAAGSGVFDSHWPSWSGDARTLEFVRQHDGAEYTLMMVETNNGQQWTDHDELLAGFVWVEPLDPQRQWGLGLGRINERPRDNDPLWNARPRSGHGRGANVLFADGRVQFLNDAIDYRAYVNLLTSDYQAAPPVANAP